jgi:HAD superfamily hydrolase (TIGR01509 family)
LKNNKSGDAFRPEAVIFDMDGLMLDTERPVVAAWGAAARTKGWQVDEAAALKTIGIDEPSTRAVLMGTYGPDFPYEEIRQELVRLMVQEADQNGIPQRPGLITLLDHLAGLGIPMVVATSTKRRSALWKLERGGILERFPLMACGDEVQRGKPAPDIFLLAAERLGKAPEVCVGFEDSPAGLQSLYAAGIRSVFVKDLIEPPDDVLQTVWQRFENLAEAVPLFT